MARSVTKSENGEGECVRLTRKLAQRIDGIDLSESAVGDTLCLNTHDADLIVAEGWGERVICRADDRERRERRPGRRSSDTRPQRP
jgi:hypothetical protein